MDDRYINLQDDQQIYQRYFEDRSQQIQENLQSSRLQQSQQQIQYLQQNHYSILPNNSNVVTSNKSKDQLNKSRQDQKKKEQQDNANIDDILNCFICMGRLQNAQMCPHCSKMCCEVCIKKWLDKKYECPHCRASLRSQNLVQCRFVQEITQAIEYKNTKEKLPDDYCEEHPDNKMQYYCKDCQTPICSDCAMFESTHKSHHFEKLTKVYDFHFSKVKDEMNILSSRLNELLESRSKIEENIERLNKQKKDRLDELKNFTDATLQKIDADQKSMIGSMLLTKKQLTDEIELFDTMKEQLEKSIMSAPKSKVIQNSHDMVSMIQEISKRDFQADLSQINLEKKDLPSDIIPEYASSTFILENFREHKMKGDEIVYSKPLMVYGIKWRLKVYPNGNGQAKNSYLSIFLEMTEGHLDSQKYEYRIEMLNQRVPNTQITREFASDFESGECWGYNRFFKIETLEQDGYLLPQENKLVFKFHVRCPNYKLQCINQKRYIEQQSALQKETETQLAQCLKRIQVLEAQNLELKGLKSSDPHQISHKTRSSQQDSEIYSNPLNASNLSRQEDLYASNSQNYGSQSNRLSENQSGKIITKSNVQLGSKTIENMIQTIKFDPEQVRQYLRESNEEEEEFKVDERMQKLENESNKIKKQFLDLIENSNSKSEDESQNWRSSGLIGSQSKEDQDEDFSQNRAFNIPNIDQINLRNGVEDDENNNQHEKTDEDNQNDDDDDDDNDSVEYEKIRDEEFYRLIQQVSNTNSSNNYQYQQQRREEFKKIDIDELFKNESSREGELQLNQRTLNDELKIRDMSQNRISTNTRKLLLESSSSPSTEKYQDNEDDQIQYASNLEEDQDRLNELLFQQVKPIEPDDFFNSDSYKIKILQPQQQNQIQETYKEDNPDDVRQVRKNLIAQFDEEALKSSFENLVNKSLGDFDQGIKKIQQINHLNNQESSNSLKYIQNTGNTSKQELSSKIGLQNLNQAALQDNLKKKISQLNKFELFSKKKTEISNISGVTETDKQN